MTELAVVIDSDKRNLLHVKVEIRQEANSTQDEIDAAHNLSENLNRMLRDAAQRSSFRKDNQEQQNDEGIVLEQGMLF